jgi:M6 family metalloprotease-like protein
MSIGESIFLSKGDTMSLDTSFYYRFTNNFLGPGQSLDVIPDGSCRLQMAQTENDSGQSWKLVDLGGGTYGLRTEYLGDCFSLDVINDGTNTTPCLAATGDYSGQFWTLAPWGDGTYKLTNAFTGPEKALDVYRGTNQPFLETGEHSGQHWTLTALATIPGNVAIPNLDPQGNADKSEGPTDFTFYARPEGTVQAVMIFVDFPNASAGSTSASETANHLLGDGRAQKLYHDQSYHGLVLDVTARTDLGWRRMPGPSTGYNFETFEAQKAYITDAAALFSPSEVNFSHYTFIFVVAPPNAGFRLSPAFNAPPGSGALTPSGEIRLGVTFGTDSYTNRFINLVHEVGHCFGLPDLYPYGGGAGNSEVGCWEIMSDIFHCVSFLGWHRHKNRWLSSSRKTYLSQSTQGWYATLSPLSGTCGLSMVVLPLDNPLDPSKVLVVEVAQPVLGSNNEYWGDGVLVYTVDATIASGSSPVVIIPKKVSTSPFYGYLYEAPYLVGDAMVYQKGTTRIVLRVLQKFGSSYNIQIEYHRE